MLVANAVVDTDQPRLQVGENQMDDRQVLLGNLVGNSEVLAALTEASIAAPIVRSAIPARRCSRRTPERLGATVEHDGEPNASGIGPSFRFRAWCPAFDDAPRWHRRREPCGEHHGLPHAFARQPRFRPPQHGSWAVHRSCLGWAAPKAKLPLKLHGGHAGRLTGDRLHHCSHRQPGVL